MLNTKKNVKNNYQLTNNLMTKCKYCQDIDELDGECMGEAHEGQNKMCGECDAEYYEEFGGKVWACNEQAKTNYPNLELL